MLNISLNIRAYIRGGCITLVFTRLDWNNILCTKRRRESSTKPDHRNEFDKDFDRVVSSSSFRRLQDKAQVFPLQENDFIRTRLTHSMEVSAIARSLGKAVAQWLLEKKEINDEQADEIPSVLAVAGLVHDIGNPPFGHFGEETIRTWFKQWFESDERDGYKKVSELYGRLTEGQKNDFLYFEGNAQAIRILTRLQFQNDHFGINFTYGTLATLIKYPHTSEHVDRNSSTKMLKKFGVFQSEKAVFQEICDATGIRHGIRSPLTFLLEAADDIAYLTADLEDGVKKGVVPWQDVYEELRGEFASKSQEYVQMFEYVDAMSERAKTNKVPERETIEVSNFRVRAQGLIIRSVIQAFQNSYEEIMAGRFQDELIAICSAAPFAGALRSIAKKHVYSSREVLTLELAGHNAIRGLLDLFVPAAIASLSNEPSAYHERLYKIISSNYEYVHRLDAQGNVRPKNGVTLYEKLQLVTDFIAGMTDSYVIDLYQRLRGLKIN
jgi:dGTPase